jgi:uncharacterized protein YcfJ
LLGHYNSEGIWRDITISTPHQECWDKEQQVGSNNKVVGNVLGGTAGGVLGHQVCGGTGKTVATVAGAIIGTIVGGNLADDGSRYQTVRKCRTINDSSTERRLSRYKNYFQYNGEMLYKVSTRKLHEVRVRVSISY